MGRALSVRAGGSGGGLEVGPGVGCKGTAGKAGAKAGTLDMGEAM